MCDADVENIGVQVSATEVTEQDDEDTESDYMIKW
jgi:hypothetical protein